MYILNIRYPKIFKNTILSTIVINGLQEAVSLQVELLEHRKLSLFEVSLLIRLFFDREISIMSRVGEFFGENQRTHFSTDIWC